MVVPSISKRISSRVYDSIVNFRAYLALDKEGRAERRGFFSVLKKHNDWLKRVPAYDLPAYREAVRDLPRPSAQQINEFVQFVSEAHSWYKLLPAWHCPGLFQFYLDPCVGYDTHELADGSVRVLERTGHSGYQYTWMPTREYRARFGYLAYHCDNGTSFMVRTGGTVRRSDEPQALAFTREGQPFLVPAELGCVALTGVIHRHASHPDYWWWFAPPDEVTAKRIMRVDRAWEDAYTTKRESIRAELDTLLRPERERQHREMHLTINQMLAGLGPQC